jgi:DNA uptake protein ComE-like DNA-binding protein
MKKLVTFLSILALGFSLSAAETAPKKEDAAKPKAPAGEAAKPSAKAEALAATLTAEQRSKLLDIFNKGDDAALTALPGVGEVRAKAIVAVRPIADVTGVLAAKGIGEGIFAQMVSYAKAGFTKPEKKAPAKKKAAPEKADAK